MSTIIAGRRSGRQRPIAGDLEVPGVLYNSWRRKNQGLSFLGRVKRANGQEHEVEVSWRFFFTLTP